VEGLGSPLHIGIVLATLVGAIYAFVREKFPPDVTALLVLLVLVISGVLTPAEGFGGFSHPATVSVAAVLVLSASLERTGVFSLLARRVLSRLGASELLFVAVLVLTVGGLSAFINNTAAVAIFLPIVLETCRRTGARPARFLIPLSFASMFGGMCTLIGTSTNIVVHEYARSVGLQGFGVFEFARVGLPLFALGGVYLLVVGRWLLPRGEPLQAQPNQYGLGEYVVDVYVEPASSWVGTRADPERFLRDHDLELVGIWRADAPLRRTPPWPKLMAGDRLRVHGHLDEIMALMTKPGLHLAPSGREVMAPLASWSGMPGEEEMVLAEVVLLPASPAVGHALETVRQRALYDAWILGMRRAGEQPRALPAGEMLRAGDALLLQLHSSQLQALTRDPAVLVTSATPKPASRTGRLALSLLTLAAVVGTAAVGLLPIVTAASAGCLLLMATRTLSPRQAYDSINWPIIFMLAGVLALGTAMEKTGLAGLMAQVLSLVGTRLDPRVALSLIFLLTLGMTELMSNSATAVLLVPVALRTAAQLGMPPEPFLMTVAIASSASFASPVGYQTNLMVYGPGGYRFTDFLRIGLPLDILFWIAATFLIPHFWPLGP
jgi:di/tricarboxylate transporter